MEFGSKIRWILVVAVSVIALILITWGLFTIASNIFRGGDNNDAVVLVDDFVDVESIGTARYEVVGPVVANENQNSYIIDVSANVVTMKTYSNYGKILTGEVSYKNTPIAYAAFLSALENADITAVSRNSVPDNTFEELGICATGRRFIVELDGGALRRWSTSCSNKQGNAGFTMSRVSLLFRRQVPDYNKMVSGTGL
jgi:hypothetical protein